MITGKLDLGDSLRLARRQCGAVEAMESLG
jgi:hypothetical protein